MREQCDRAKFVALDSMNLWIEIARDSLVQVIERVDCVLLNDAELRMLTGQPNLVRAAREVISWGPRAVVAKQGEYGAALFTAERFFGLPAYPAGDRSRPDRRRRHLRRRLRRLPSPPTPTRTSGDDLLRRAMAHGTALASFNVEQFGTERVSLLAHGDRRSRPRARRHHPLQRRPRCRPARSGRPGETRATALETVPRARMRAPARGIEFEFLSSPPPVCTGAPTVVRSGWTRGRSCG